MKLNVRNLAFIVGLFLVFFSLIDSFFNTNVASIEAIIGVILALSSILWPVRKPKRMDIHD